MYFCQVYLIVRRNLIRKFKTVLRTMNIVVLRILLENEMMEDTFKNSFRVFNVFERNIPV